jgi:hypothetical protein
MQELDQSGLLWSLDGLDHLLATPLSDDAESEKYSRVFVDVPLDKDTRLIAEQKVGLDRGKGPINKDDTDPLKVQINYETQNPDVIWREIIDENGTILRIIVFRYPPNEAKFIKKILREPLETRPQSSRSSPAHRQSF